jgi:hypothetical protein
MNLYIDCEWNGYKGQLMSMALVSNEGHEWYEVIDWSYPVIPWVAENVLVKLGKSPITQFSFQNSLANFLAQFDTVHIVGDWPEDISRFCEALITGPGTRLNTPPLTMEVLRVDSISLNPHNALADAKGLRDRFKGVTP